MGCVSQCQEKPWLRQDCHPCGTGLRTLSKAFPYGRTLNMSDETFMKWRDDLKQDMETNHGGQSPMPPEDECTSALPSDK